MVTEYYVSQVENLGISLSIKEKLQSLVLRASPESIPLERDEALEKNCLDKMLSEFDYEIPLSKY